MTEYSTFRRTAWDPVLIVAQIVTLQCFGYSTFSALMAGASVLTDVRLGPQLLFDARLVRGDTVEGWVIGAGLLAMGAANILPLVYMVERSRLCVDFSLTFFAVHLILVWWHQAAPPLTLPWWLAVATSGALMAVGGRAACLRRELLPIAIRSYMPVRTPEAHPDHGGPAGAEEHELETRLPAAGPGRSDARRQEPSTTEVLFDASQAAGAAQPRASGTSTDGWSNDDWGMADDDSGGRPSAPRQQPPARSATPLAAPKGGKDD
ncbi:hypothetical protein H4R19_002642 [Coemansia spiralis]|nr:hypothetical protein H4R19_002642 [Coemansia spiralis]